MIKIKKKKQKNKKKTTYKYKFNYVSKINQKFDELQNISVLTINNLISI